MNPALDRHAAKMRSESTGKPNLTSGFSQLPNQSLVHFARLLSGSVQIVSVLFINAETQWGGKRRKSRPITHAELAEVCRCTLRAVETKLKDLIDRGVLIAKRTAEGMVYEIPFEKWPELPDKPDESPQALNNDSEEPEEEDEPEPIKAKFVPVFSKRLSLKAGKKTKPIQFACEGAADKIQFDTNCDLECDGYFNAGVLRLSIFSRQTNSEQKRKKLRFAKSQDVENTDQSKFEALHSLMDDYCRNHHGAVPSDKLLSKISQALGEATVKDLLKVVQARIRGGKVIPMPWFINLAEDAARAVVQRPPKVLEPPPNRILPGKEQEARDYCKKHGIVSDL